LPVFAELKDYLKKRADLGQVKVLRQEFSVERIRTQSENARALSDGTTEQQRIEEIEAEIGALILPEDLLAQEKTVQGLVEELGSVLKAQKDLPRVQGQVLEANQAARGILSDLRPDLSLKSGGVLRLTVDWVERIRRLTDEHGKLTVRKQSAAEVFSGVSIQGQFYGELIEVRTNMREKDRFTYSLTCPMLLPGTSWGR